MSARCLPACVCLAVLAGLARPARADGSDATMRFSDATNAAPTDVEVDIEIQNPDGTWGTVFMGPISIPARATATQKRDLIVAAMRRTLGDANVQNNGANGLDAH